MRFQPEMMEAARTLTGAGWIVLAPFVSDYIGGQDADIRKRMLDDMHFRKIDMSDRICVVASGAAAPFHIGESTEREIQYAANHGKGVYYWTQHFGMTED
jgi:hypothetical protein